MEQVIFRSHGRANFSFFVDRTVRVIVKNGYATVSNPRVISALEGSRMFTKLTKEEQEALTAGTRPKVSPAAAAIIAGQKPPEAKPVTHTDETPAPAPKPATSGTGTVTSSTISAVSKGGTK